MDLWRPIFLPSSWKHSQMKVLVVWVNRQLSSDSWPTSCVESGSNNEKAEYVYRNHCKAEEYYDFKA